MPVVNYRSQNMGQRLEGKMTTQAGRSKTKSAISTQEAALRLSLGIHGPWDKLGRGQTLSLRNAYTKIISEVASILANYESSLAEICAGMRRLNSIDPFSNDQESLALKAKAIDDASSLLRSHSLPFPLPTSIASLQRLKKEWPSIKARRRRAIRTQKCKELSLPLNSSWEQIQKEAVRLEWVAQEVAAERLRRQDHPFNIIQSDPGSHARIHRHFTTKNSSTIRYCRGFVYLKRWQMPHGVCWYKLGITSNPNRRNSEQNVLPVPAEIIACVDVGSMERARLIEADFRRELDSQQIRNASNRELYELSPGKLSELHSKFIQLAGS